ncbi:MAG: tRNA uridine(34) 5-carboxymethylaminomethyl modification radical SAM/GNAT enzyme Elp3, partial [Candidatus Aenigmatarchaeota archaeon]
DFDSFEQTRNRLEQLKLTGHPTSKIDLIVMGGTFPARDFNYQKEFVKGCFDALNGRRSEDLQESKHRNERTENRCVGLTVETRPDFSKKEDIDRMLELGTTRVEMGVQIPDDQIYQKIKREHTVKDVIESTKFLKDSGLKVTYHYMPGLPGSGPEKDLEEFRNLFSDERYMPDSLKIYPTLVVENSELERWYKEGKYEPYDDEELVDLLCEMKDEIPPWARVMRLHRDIPSDSIVAGCRSSNLRQIVHRKMEERKESCRCVRCREIGRNGVEVSDLDLNFRTRSYDASGGKEYFLSYEDESEDVIAGLLRFRIPDEPFREEIDGKTGLVRELHVYGSEIPVESEKNGVQHSGFGRKLLQRAEELGMNKGMGKMAVMSGVGAREYYRKFGYTLKGPYMTKSLKE